MKLIYEKAVKQFMDNLKMLDRSEETIDSYGKDLRYINIFLQNKYNGPVYIKDVSKKDLEDFLLYQKNRGLSSASRSRNLYTMRSFFKYCMDSGIIVDRNPAALIGGIRVKNKEREILDKEEVYKLYNAMSHKIARVVVIFLFFSGLRISEALNLKIKSKDNSDKDSYIDLDESLVIVKSGKGDKDRVVPINVEIASILQDYLLNIRPKISKELEKNYFFATKRTGRISAQYVNREIKKGLKVAGIDKDISSHNLRHSYATALLNTSNPVNILQVSRLLGHSSIETTQIYAKTSISDLESAVEGL